MKSLNILALASVLLAGSIVSSQALLTSVAITGFPGAATSDLTFLNNTTNSGSASFGFFASGGSLTVMGGLVTNLLTELQISALGPDPSALMANFVSFGTSTDFELFSLPGLFGGNFTPSAFDPADAPGGLPLTAAQYNALVAGSASIFGLFTATDEVGVFNSNTALTAAVNGNPLSGITDADFGLSGTAVAGLGNVTAFASPFGTNRLELVNVVPEPSRALLGLIGVMGIALRRRRA